MKLFLTILLLLSVSCEEKMCRPSVYYIGGLTNPVPCAPNAVAHVEWLNKDKSKGWLICTCPVGNPDGR